MENDLVNPFETAMKSVAKIEPDEPDFDNPFEAALDPVRAFTPKLIEQGIRDKWSWDRLSSGIKELGGNPDQYSQLKPQFDLNEARQKQAGQGIGTIQSFKRDYMPGGDFVQMLGLDLPIGGRVVSPPEYYEAGQKFKKGEHSKEDLDTIALYERHKEIDQGIEKDIKDHEDSWGLGAKLIRSLGGLGKVTGEAVPAVGLIGKLGKINQLRKGTQAAAVVAEPTKLASSLSFLGKNAAMLPFTPAQWVPMAHQINERENRDPNDLRGFPTAVAYGYLQNIVLGRLTNNWGQSAAKGAVKEGAEEAGRMGMRGALAKGAGGVAEMSALDFAVGTVEKIVPKEYRTGLNFGTMGKVSRGLFSDSGELREGLEDLIVQTLSFSALAKLHSFAEGRQEKVDQRNIEKAIEELAKGAQKEGKTKEELDADIAEVGLTSRLKSALTKNPYVTKEQLEEEFADIGEGPYRVMADAIINDHVEVEPPTQAPTPETAPKPTEVVSGPPDVVPTGGGDTPAVNAPPPAVPKFTNNKAFLKATGLAEADKALRAADYDTKDTTKFIRSFDSLEEYQKAIEADPWAEDGAPSPKEFTDFAQKYAEAYFAQRTPVVPTVGSEPTNTKPPESTQVESEIPPTTTPAEPPIVDSRPVPANEIQVPGPTVGKIGLETPPAASEKPTPAGSPVDRVRAKIRSALSRTTLPSETKLEYEASVSDAFSRLSPAARDRLDKNLGETRFFSGYRELTISVLEDFLDKPNISSEQRTRYQAELQSVVRGETKHAREAAVDPSTGVVYLDGAEIGSMGGKYSADTTSLADVYLHEFMHIIDLHQAFSKTPGWMEAYKEEIDLDGDPLTVYARVESLASEGFAEFGRIVGDSRISTARLAKDFPRASKFFKDNGLWPSERRGTGGGPTEAFNERVGAGEGPHIDAEKTEVTAEVPTVGSEKPENIWQETWDSLDAADRKNLDPSMLKEFVANGVDVSKTPALEKKQAIAGKYDRPFTYEKQSKENTGAGEALLGIIDQMGLSGPEARVIRGRISGKSLEEVGETAGRDGGPVTKQRARQLEVLAIGKLKRRIDEMTDEEFEKISGGRTKDELRGMLGLSHSDIYREKAKSIGLDKSGEIQFMKTGRLEPKEPDGPDESLDLDDFETYQWHRFKRLFDLYEGAGTWAKREYLSGAMWNIKGFPTDTSRAEKYGFRDNPGFKRYLSDMRIVDSGGTPPDGGGQPARKKPSRELIESTKKIVEQEERFQKQITEQMRGLEGLSEDLKGRLVEQMKRAIDESKASAKEFRDRLAGVGEPVPPEILSVRLWPRRKVPTVGTPPVDYKADNPKVEARYESNRGIERETLGQKLWDFATKAWHSLTRAHEFLANTRENAMVNEGLRLLKAVPKNSVFRALTDISKVVGELDQDQLAIFERHLLVANQLHGLELALAPEFRNPLRLGFESRGEVEAYKAKLDKLVAADPAIQKAILTREGSRHQLVKAAMDAGIGGITKEALDNEAYFHQQVSAFVDGGRFKGGSIPLRIGRDFQRARTTGVESLPEEFDYNTSFIEAEAKWMTEMRVELAKEKILKDYILPYDQIETVMATARANGRHWQEVAREMFPDHTVWSAQPGTIYYKAHTLNERLAETLLKDSLNEMNIRGDDLRNALVMGGMRRPSLLPAEITEQLNSMLDKPASNEIEQVSEHLMGYWKVWTLLNPKRLFGYTARNMTGDIEPVLAAAPWALAKVGRAFRESWDLYSGKGRTPDILRALELDALESGITETEIPKSEELGAFKHLYDSPSTLDKLNPPKAIESYFSMARKFNSFRESVGRYAVYLHYLEAIQKGEKFNYGGAKKEVVDELIRQKGPEVAAAHLSRNLLGDYGNLTKFGQYARKHLAPFYSWIEINFKRWPRLAANAVSEARQGNLAPGAAILATNLARMTAMYAAVYAWNNTVMKDEERDLTPEDRAGLHLTLGRTSDGSVRVFRRVGSLSEFTDWFGVPEAVALLPQYRADQLSTKDYAGEIGLAPVNKAVQAFRPDVKLGAELGIGQSLYPDVSRPRPQGRDEILAGSLGLRDELKAVKREAGSGDTVKHGYLSGAVGLARQDPGQAALSEIHDLRKRFMKTQGRAEEPAYGASSIAKLRDAARGDDPKAFADAKRNYLGAGGNLKKFTDAIDNMDPVKGKLNEADEAKFTGKFLTGEQKDKLKLAREKLKEQKAKMLSMWKG